MTDSRVEAARLSLASAANHLDAAKHHVVVALGHLDGEARGRAAGALGHVYRALAALADIEKLSTINDQVVDQ
jgi:hypothetical protein